MKKLLLTLPMLWLAACDVPQISPEARAVFAGKTQEEIMPRLPAKTVLTAFSRTCETHLNDLNGAVALLKSQGYIKLAQKDELSVYAHPDGKPLFGIAGEKPTKPELCMVLFPNEKKTIAAVQAHVRKRGGKSPDLPLPIFGATTFWEAKSANPPRLYIQVEQSTDQTGPSAGLAVGKI